MLRVGTQADLEKKIESLSRAEYVVVPEGVLPLRNMSDEQIQAYRQANIAQSDARWSSQLGLANLYPIDFKTTRLPFDPVLTEVRFIALHYQPIRRANGWVLMAPNKAAGVDTLKSSQQSAEPDRPSP